MIQELKDNILCVQAEEQDSKFPLDVLNSLKGEVLWDVILDCTQIPTFDLAGMEVVRDFQKQRNRLLVLVGIDVEDDWISIPTKKEAFDYISFEQMQRDLGI